MINYDECGADEWIREFDSKKYIDVMHVRDKKAIINL